MPINNITQTISTIPEAGRRGVDVQSIFVTKQEDFQDHLQGITVTELNALVTQQNTMAGAMNSTATQVNTDANTATTKAGEANTSASSASTSASEALTSRNQAETFAQQASASALSVDASNIVHITGNETIAGVKTFSSNIVGNITGNAGTATKLATARTINGVNFDGSANITVSDSTAVKLSGNQTVAGVKTFSSNPISTSTQSTAIDALTRKDYVDTKVAKVTSSDNSIVRFDGTDGYIQNSQVVIDDNGNMSSGGIIASYNNYIASTDYTDGNYIRMIRQGSQGLEASLEVVVQNTKTVEILPNGSYLSKSYGAIGYGSGAGGIVTQVNSKSFEVALNKPTGIIITHNQTLTAGQSVIFPVYNVYFDSLNDIAYPIVVGSSNYRVESLILASDNKYHIKLTNVSASSLSEYVEIRFVIFKGARQ